jgi:hypothetical protein
VRGRHASHITVVLSKAAHSGPSVCLRARASCPLHASRPGADRAERAAQAAGVSVQCDLQVLALPSSLGLDRRLRCRKGTRYAQCGQIAYATPSASKRGELQEARATAAKHWTERVWYCHN